MDPETALQLLDQAAAAAPLTRQNHVMALQAVEVLRAAISPQEEVKPPKKPRRKKAT